MVEQLQQLGFNQYEAQAYIALLRENPLNGYELARASGIPRPNIYAVLQKLEERGAVLRLDHPEGTRYSPVAPDELIRKLRQRYQTSLEAASSALREVSTPPAVEYVLNLRGYPALIEQAWTLLEAAQQRLLVSVWPEEATALGEAFDRAQARGVQITTLCLRGCPQPCPACRGAVFRHALAPAEGGRWLVIVVDDLEMLAGQITQQGEAYSVRTRQKMLVNLSGGYIQNSIALASILSRLHQDPETVLDPQTIAALNGPGGGASWLEMLRQAIR